ncbi:MAG TPA: hypothetical protein VGO93_09830 [Candidatus Xenobia bacterium]|jgi:hypothetical protein
MKHAIVLQDENGNLYVVRPDMLMQAMVPPGLARDAHLRIQTGAPGWCRGDETGFRVVAGIDTAQA